MTEHITTNNSTHLFVWAGLVLGIISATLAILHFLSSKHILQLEVPDTVGKFILLGGPLLGLLTLIACVVGLVLNQEVAFRVLLGIGCLLALIGILFPPLISMSKHEWVKGVKIVKVNFLVQDAKDELLASGQAKARQIAQFEELMPLINKILEKNGDPMRVKSIKDLEAMANKKIISLGRYGNSWLYATGIEWELDNDAK